MKYQPTNMSPDKLFLRSGLTLALVILCGASIRANADNTAPPPVPGKTSTITDSTVIEEANKMSGDPHAMSPDDPPSPDILKDTIDNYPTPEDLRNIKKLWEGLRRETETPRGSQPKPVISTQNLNLSPGTTPPVVRISDETGVILDFMDAKGSPWPIDHVVNMSSNQIDTEEKSLDPKKDQNSIFCKSRKYGGSGNVAIYLKSMPTPVIITLLSGQKEVDYRVDFRVPAVLSTDKSGLFGGYQKTYFDNRLASATMGIAPDGCHQWKTSSKQVMVWGCKDDMIVRADGILLSPAPIDGQKMDSIDGTKAYEVPKTPVLSVATDGAVNLVSVEIKDDE